jgi:hypothetical protein
MRKVGKEKEDARIHHRPPLNQERTKGIPLLRCSKSTLVSLAQFLKLPGFPQHATFVRDQEPFVFRSQSSPLDCVGDVAQKEQRFDAEVGFLFFHACH